MSHVQGQSVGGYQSPPTSHSDFTDYLPTELLHQIFGYIDVDSLEKCLLVSRQWRLYSSRARAARGRRHIKLIFRIVGGMEANDKTMTYWLWRNDMYSNVLEVLRKLCEIHLLNELSSFEWSFDNSFEADIVKLLAAESPSVMDVQLRISGYMDRTVRPNNQVRSLVTRSLDLEGPLICGVLSRISTRTL